jgi:hypothetical protein
MPLLSADHVGFLPELHRVLLYLLLYACVFWRREAADLISP